MTRHRKEKFPRLICLKAEVLFFQGLLLMTFLSRRPDFSVCRLNFHSLPILKLIFLHGASRANYFPWCHLMSNTTQANLSDSCRIYPGILICCQSKCKLCIYGYQSPELGTCMQKHWFFQVLNSNHRDRSAVAAINQSILVMRCAEFPPSDFAKGVEMRAGSCRRKI